MKLGGCQVVIKCGGVAMREYDLNVIEHDKKIRCYIASQPGKEFYIEYSRQLNFGPPNTELAADVYFGGVFDGPGWIAPDPPPRAKKVVGEIWGSRRGEKLHSYAFSKPQVIDGETPSSIDPERIGEIEVCLGFMAESEMIEKDPDQRLLNFGPIQVNEKDKKLGVHCAGPTSEASAEECTEEMFFGAAPYEDALSFTFICRAEEWLQAKGIIRKRRRRGEVQPPEDLEVPPLPKSEPLEEEVPNLRIAQGGEVLSVTPPRPRPRSPTLQSYAGDEPAVQSKGGTRPVVRPAGQEDQKPTPTDETTTLKRPRKIPRHSENITLATSTATRTAEKDTPRSKGKVEWDSLVPKVKLEEGSSVPKVKEEVTEVMVNELRELEDADGKTSQLKKKKASLLQKMAASPP